MTTTFADIKADIADSIDDTTGEYASQIAKAVKKAIRFCERTNYYFNQSRDITFPTVSGQEFYGAADNADIPSLVHIDEVYSEDSQGARRVLLRYQNADIEIISDNSAAHGEPYCYAYFNQQVRLYPIPNAAVFTIRLQVDPYRLTPLSADADTNAWLTEAYDMVFERAKYELAADTLKDPDLAVASFKKYAEQADELARETSKRMATGLIRATEF